MSGRKNKSSVSRTFFTKFWDWEDVKVGLERGELVEGNVRINQRNFEESFMDDPDGLTDIYINGMKDRNRALHGDLVVVKVKPKEEWRVSDDYNLVLSTQNKVPVKSTPIPRKKPNFHLDENVVNLLKELKLYRDETNGMAEETVIKPPLTPSNNNSNGEKKSTYQRIGDFPPTAHIPDEFIQKTAEVVFIKEKIHSRCAFGVLRQLPNENSKMALFAPSDSRIPRIRVPLTECPLDFQHRLNDYKNTLFVAKITNWNEMGVYAEGTLDKVLGEVGDIEAETEGLLMQYDIKPEIFDAEVLSCLPVIPDGGWRIPAAEFGYRRDFRDELLFTIDPATARDLDDALHIKPMEDGWFEVGVHIADVSYFVPPDSALDDAAQIRGNSCYLVHKVVPMLPRLLCEELCSLNPGVERLSFSVVWQMNEAGEIRAEWFGRSVIKSCCQLNYDVAQGFIAADPDKEWNAEDLPTIHNGKTPKEICQAVLLFNRIAKNLRKNRFDHGALRLDQPKLSFTLDSDKKTPIGCAIYNLKDSNRLIEEFMLLANMAVARQIYSAFPTLAVLRRHPPPKPKILQENADICASMGYPVDISSSKSLNNSIVAYLSRPNMSDEEKSAVTVMIQLMSRSMVLAMYFCTGVLQEESQFAHFALAVPLYTHFTSPIRRYPDVLVHRLLAASLDYSEAPQMSPKELQKICCQCNKAKLDAKTVSDTSAEMFFALFVRQCGPLETRGVVMNIFDRSFDVLLVKFGLVRRVYCEQLNLQGWNYSKGPPPLLDLMWKSSEKPGGVQDRIQLFGLVDLVLVKTEEPLKFKTLMKPLESDSGNSRKSATKIV